MIRDTEVLFCTIMIFIFDNMKRVLELERHVYTVSMIFAQNKVWTSSTDWRNSLKTTEAITAFMLHGLTKKLSLVVLLQCPKRPD